MCGVLCRMPLDGRILAFVVALFASEKYGISDGYCFRSC